MKKSQFSELQIVAILKEADAGVKVQDIWRKYNISTLTYSKRKSKYGDMGGTPTAERFELPT